MHPKVAFLNLLTELAHVIWTMRRDRPVTPASFLPPGRIRSRSTNPKLAGCHKPIQLSVQVTVVEGLWTVIITD